MLNNVKNNMYFDFQLVTNQKGTIAPSNYTLMQVSSGYIANYKQKEKKKGTFVIEKKMEKT